MNNDNGEWEGESENGDRVKVVNTYFHHTVY